MSAIVADSARDAGFIVNLVAPDAIRIAPPLNLTIAEIDLFVDACPGCSTRQGVRMTTVRHLLRDDDLSPAEQRHPRQSRPDQGPPFSDRTLVGPGSSA